MCACVCVHACVCVCVIGYVEGRGFLAAGFEWLCYLNHHRCFCVYNVCVNLKKLGVGVGGGLIPQLCCEKICC